MSDFSYQAYPGGSGTLSNGGTAALNFGPGMIVVTWLTAIAASSGSVDFVSNVSGLSVGGAATGYVTNGGSLNFYAAFTLAAAPPPGVYELAVTFAGSSGGTVYEMSCAFNLTFAGANASAVPNANAPVVNNMYPTQSNGAWVFPVGAPINIQLSATGQPTSWRATQIPTGLAIDNTGSVTGYIEQAGAYQMTVIATNSAGDSAPWSFSITITAATGAAVTAAPLAWLPPELIDLQVDMVPRSVSSSLLGLIQGFTEGEDVQFAVLPRLAGTLLVSGITALTFTARPMGNFQCAPLIVDLASPSLVAVQFPITVTSASTSSTSVTVSTLPSNFVVGCTLLGQLVTAIGGGSGPWTVTLAGNASANVASATVKQFTNPAQQYYALTFNLESSRIKQWFREANAAPVVNSPLKVAAAAVLAIAYNGHAYVTASFPFTVLQNIAAPDQF